MPPSLPRHTRVATFGSQAIPCWSACTEPEVAHVVPPFVDSRRLTSALKTRSLFSGSTQRRPNHHSKPLLPPAPPPAAKESPPSFETRKPLSAPVWLP